MDTFPKPFKNFTEQLEILEARNVHIEDKKQAEKILSNYSYYTLINGYKELFLENKSPERYLPGTSLEIFYRLFLIESTMKSSILQVILLVERSLKTKLAYVISKNFGVKYDSDLDNPTDNYLYKRHYSSRRNERNAILKQILERSASAPKNSNITYYKNKHNHVPAWILVDRLTFGLAMKWYGILRPSEKEEIINMVFPENLELEMDEKKELFIQLLKLVKDYRNIISHGVRLAFSTSNIQINQETLKKIVPNNVLSDEDIKNGFGNSCLYVCFIACMILLQDSEAFWFCMAPFVTWERPIAEQNLTSSILLRQMFNLPPNYIERLHLIDNIFN